MKRIDVLIPDQLLLGKGCGRLFLASASLESSTYLGTCKWKEPLVGRLTTTEIEHVTREYLASPEYHEQPKVIRYS